MGLDEVLLWCQARWLIRDNGMMDFFAPFAPLR